MNGALSISGEAGQRIAVGGSRNSDHVIELVGSRIMRAIVGVGSIVSCSGYEENSGIFGFLDGVEHGLRESAASPGVAHYVHLHLGGVLDRLHGIFESSGARASEELDRHDRGMPVHARDMAAASRSIAPARLQTGDLVFFNTSGSSKYSHVGLYIGNGEFIHAPSSRGTIRTEKLSNPYFSQRFTGAHTFF